MSLDRNWKESDLLLKSVQYTNQKIAIIVFNIVNCEMQTHSITPTYPKATSFWYTYEMCILFTGFIIITFCVRFIWPASVCFFAFIWMIFVVLWNVEVSKFNQTSSENIASVINCQIIQESCWNLKVCVRTLYMLLQKCGLVFSVQDPGDACVAGVLFLVSVGFVVVIFLIPWHWCYPQMHCHNLKQNKAQSVCVEATSSRDVF